MCNWAAGAGSAAAGSLRDGFDGGIPWDIDRRSLNPTGSTSLIIFSVIQYRELNATLCYLTSAQKYQAIAGMKKEEEDDW